MSTKMKEDIVHKIEIPEGVDIEKDGSLLKIKGKRGELSRSFAIHGISISIKNRDIIIEAKRATKREKKIAGTFKAHIKNMIKGVLEGHRYRLKACSSHFPMSISIENGFFVVRNFLGEKAPRKTPVIEGVEIEIKGNDITVISNNKEAAGQMAANIEQLTKIKEKDRRVFQDGIYITHINEKEVHK